MYMGGYLLIPKIAVFTLALDAHWPQNGSLSKESAQCEPVKAIISLPVTKLRGTHRKKCSMLFMSLNDV